MNNQAITIPVGTQVSGRVLNASGEPIDKKGLIKSSAQRLPLSGPASSPPGETQTPPDQLFEAGIKAIDLLAPIPRGGIIGLFAGVGLGNLVVAEELMYNIVTRHSGYIVCLGMDASSYEASELMEAIREAEIESRTAMVFEQLTDSPEIRQRLVRTGVTIAQQFLDLGHPVLLVADKNVASKGSLASTREMRSILKEKAITAILLGSEDDHARFYQEGMLDDLDGQIILSPELRKQNQWPAIDRLSTRSRLLDSGAISADHVQVAQQVRQLLRRYSELQNAIDTPGLSEEDQKVVRRAQSIQLFFTQPFFVAEAYTDIPGEYVTIEETIKGFKALLEGRYDDLPVEAFRWIGVIEQALAKSKNC